MFRKPRHLAQCNSSQSSELAAMTMVLNRLCRQYRRMGFHFAGKSRRSGKDTGDNISSARLGFRLRLCRRIKGPFDIISAEVRIKRFRFYRILHSRCLVIMGRDKCLLRTDSPLGPAFNRYIPSRLSTTMEDDKSTGLGLGMTRKSATGCMARIIAAETSRTSGYFALSA